MSVSDAWEWYRQNREDIAPLLAPLGSLFVGLGTIFVGVLVAWAALGQARIARQRHEKQTETDHQRRVTESFSKAVEQLAHDKTEVRLGGIYTLKRISRDESPDDYFAVMETLCAFVRGRASLANQDADIAAALGFIIRRSQTGREREVREGWRVDLSGADLRTTNPRDANPEGRFDRGILFGAHLENARLYNANFNGSDLRRAHFEGADLRGAHFEGADLRGVHFQRADLRDARLERAILHSAHFKGADLQGAYLEGARLGGPLFSPIRGTYLDNEGIGDAEISQDQLDSAYGDAFTTVLPVGLQHPSYWPYEPPIPDPQD